MATVRGADLTVQADLGSRPFILDVHQLGAPSGTQPVPDPILYPADDAYDDITCEVSSADWSWGSDEPLGPLTECAGGRARLSLLDPARDFDPSNTSSPFFNALRVGTPLRVLVDGNPAWSGTLEQWSHDLGGATSDLLAVDALGTLAALILPAATNVPAGTTAAQAGAILNAAGWPTNQRDFSGGSAGSRSAQVVEGSALDALSVVRFAEHAALWAKRDGSIGWRGRDEPWEPPPAVTINCGGAALGSLSSVLARGRVRNVVLIEGATPASYSVASAVRHGPRTVSTSKDDLAFTSSLALATALDEVGETAAPTTQTLNATKSSLLAQSGSTQLGGGKDQHIPIGYSGGYNLRGCVGFEAPDWSGVSAVTSAILWLKTSTQVHLAFGSDSRVLVRRITASWTPNGASSGAEGGSGWSTSGLVYPGPNTTSSSEKDDPLPETEGSWTSVDITSIMRACAPAAAGGSGASWYGLAIRPSDENSATRNNEFYSAEASSSNRPYIVLTVATNKRPVAPTPLAPVGLGALATSFQFRVSDPEGDPITNWQVLLKDATGATVWNPTGGGTLSAGIVTIPYAGPALTAQTYSWQARASDAGGYGSYSTAVTFTPGSLPATPEASWAQAVLTALGEPAVLSELGTIMPEDSEVVPVLCGEFGDRWRVIDTHTSPVIDRQVRLIGQKVSVGPDRIEVDAVTEDLPPVPVDLLNGAGSFEAAGTDPLTLGWTKPAGGTFTCEAGIGPVDGTKLLKAVGTGTSNPRLQLKVAVVAGRQYTLTAYMARNAAAPSLRAECWLDTYNGLTLVTAKVLNLVGSATTMTATSGVYTIPATGVTHVLVSLVIPFSSPGASDIDYFDAVTLMGLP